MSLAKRPNTGDGIFKRLKRYALGLDTDRPANAASGTTSRHACTFEQPPGYLLLKTGLLEQVLVPSLNV